MNKYLKITPEGTRDYLFDECRAFTDVCQKIQRIFEAKNFHQVITPCIEFYDLFSLEYSGIPQETMFKTTDNKGRILVMRPDSTLPIARMASTRLKNNVGEKFRLFYRQAVYRNNPTLTGRYNEIMQMGIELLGAVGEQADLEVITTAIESMEAVCTDFRFEIGHSLFLKALLRQIEADDETKLNIKTAMENRNYTLLYSILDKLSDARGVSALRKLPRMFGGEEVFAQAADLCETEEAMEALKYVESMYRSLCGKFPRENICVDLALVQRNDYYSGIVFLGYVNGIGDAVLSGGRYDMLMDSFDCPMGASGFAINIDALASQSNGGMS